MGWNRNRDISTIKFHSYTAGSVTTYNFLLWFLPGYVLFPDHRCIRFRSPVVGDRSTSLAIIGPPGAKPVKIQRTAPKRREIKWFLRECCTDGGHRRQTISGTAAGDKEAAPPLRISLRRDNNHVEESNQVFCESESRTEPIIAEANEPIGREKETKEEKSPESSADVLRPSLSLSNFVAIYRADPLLFHFPLPLPLLRFHILPRTSINGCERGMLRR